MTFLIPFLIGVATGVIATLVFAMAWDTILKRKQRPPRAATTD